MFSPKPLQKPMFYLAMASTMALHTHAQNAPEAVNSLKEVQVVNTSPLPGIGIEKNKLPYEVQSVNSETLKASNSLNISEFMNENLNGVNINDIQGSPYQADVTYRGSRASAILGAAQGLSVYMDGVRVNEPFGDVVNWDMLPEAAFENVTLVPGSNPLYGLNTLGGALAFTTKSGLTTQGNELGVSFGSFGRTKIDLTHGSKSADGWHRFIAGTAFSEKGWRDYSKGSLQNIFVKAGRSQADTNWDVSFLYGSSKLVGNGLTPSTNYGEVDGPSLADATPGLYEINRKSVYSHPDESQNKTTLLTFNLQHALDADTELATTAYVRYGKQKRLGGDVEWNDADPTANPAVIGEEEGELRRSNTSQNSFGLSANLTKILGNHQLTSGASLDQSRSTYGANVQEECHINEATREVTQTNCDPAADTAGVKGTATSLGLFLSDTFQISNQTFLTVGGRYNQTTVKNTLTSFQEIVDGNLDFRASPLVKAEEKFTFRKFNPSFGLSHKLNDSTTLFGNWSQSNRAPTVIELGCADENEPCQLPTGLQADPYLKQVVAQTTEAGLRWKNNQNYSLAVSAYQTNNKDDILFLPAPIAGYGYFKNFAKTQYQGVDISASKSWGTVRMSTAYSYLKATYQATAELLAGEREMDITPGMRLPGLPKNTLKLNLDWQTTSNLNLGAGLQHSSSIVTQGNEDGKIGEDANGPVAGDLSIKGFTLLNLKATYQAAKGLTVFGKINNATNKRYETYGMVGQNNFTPSGGLIDGANGDEPTVAKFVAPGAPRSLWVGMRYKF
jgi:outer membrane receptor protein involved in Fe transport